MKYDFYYSAKQAALFRSINKGGGQEMFHFNHDRRATSRKTKIAVNTINGVEYTACCEHGIGHGCKFDDIVFVCSENSGKIKIGPEVY